MKSFQMSQLVCILIIFGLQHSSASVFLKGMAVDSKTICIIFLTMCLVVPLNGLKGREKNNTVLLNTVWYLGFKLL
jgi:hypothetical protein